MKRGNLIRCIFWMLGARILLAATGLFALSVTAGYADDWIVCKQRGEVSTRIEACTDVIERSQGDKVTGAPYWADLYSMRGFAYVEAGKYDLAIRDFDEAIRIRPYFAYGYFNRANAYAAKGEAASALADFRNVVRLSPEGDPWRASALQRIYEVHTDFMLGPEGGVLPTIGRPEHEGKPVEAPIPPQHPFPVSMPESSNTKTELDAREIYRRVSPSVYMLLATPSLPIEQASSISQGSAVAIDNYYALTNCHVLSGNQYFALINSETAFEARLWAGDPATDKCIVQTNDRLRPIRSARASDELEIGETVYSVGSPATLQLTMADGIVSSLRLDGSQRVIQTTAAISVGSSGGALVDSKGNLIGITTSYVTDAQNLNFAIAIEEFWSEGGGAAVPLTAELPPIPETPAQPSVGVDLTDTDLPEGDFTGIRNLSYSQCRSACMARPQCLALTYNVICWLKSAVGHPRPFVGATSWVKP